MRFFFLFALVASSIRSVQGANDREQEAFFEKKIRPVLVAECYECHSAASKEPQGGLLLDTREGIRRGGDNGHAVVPGELGDSLLLDALRHESFAMPPEKQLSEEVIQDFETWIRRGAYDPREGKSALIRREIDWDAAKEFWSFRPTTVPSVPTTTDTRWARTDIDRFVLSRLEKEGLQPVADATPRQLVRRIYFDLIGLPPSPEQVEEFVKQSEQNHERAMKTLVDQLLLSRHFGERWGRHWLDVVRYAESTGMERNGTFTRAWRYRDYVIDAFNQDLPYDQFIREQIAGDLLSFESKEERDRQLIATGMLAIGPKSLNETKKEKFKMDVVDEQIDVVTRSFLGVTASCARCHDHKFDPIPQSEYYALAGIFTSTDTHYGTVKTNGNRNPGKLLAINGDKVAAVPVNGGAKGANEEKRYRNQVKSFQRKAAALKTQLAKAKTEAARRPIRKRISENSDDLRRANARLRQASQPKDSLGDDAMLVMAVGEAARISDTKLRIRGEPDEYGREVPRGFLTIGSDRRQPLVKSEDSGRMELAEWIVRPENPLTARVAVNRVWQHLFGRGIVGTVNNFGANGERPTHPELLDHLAAKLVEDQWSLKSVIRRIVLSRVYQLSIAEDANALAADPGNRLLWRMNQRRLEAEAIRDAMLFVSGELDLEAPDGSIVQRMGEGIIGRNLKTDGLAEEQCRSVYLPIVRGAVPEMLALFDFPEPSIVGGARNVTTVPTQALYMMNSANVLQRSEKLAALVMERSESAEERVQYAYQMALARNATRDEVKRALEFVADADQTLQNGGKGSRTQSQATSWTGVCQALFASSEFRYLN